MSETDPAQRTSPIPRRSWAVRWSLRVMIGFVTLACVGLAWLGHRYHIGLTHEDVASEVDLECVVHWQLTHTVQETAALSEISGDESHGLIPITRSRKVKGANDWTIALGAEPMFQRIQSIAQRRSLTEAELQHMVDQISRLDRVAALDLNGNVQKSRLTQTQLAQILSHVSVEVLVAPRTQLDSARFPQLNYYPLRVLDLSHTRFGDATVDDLPESLEELYVVRTAISDAGLDKLARLKNLNYLDIRRTPTSEEAAERLRRQLPDCTVLWSAL